MEWDIQQHMKKLPHTREHSYIMDGYALMLQTASQSITFSSLTLDNNSHKLNL